jgi:hypothetical protein
LAKDRFIDEEEMKEFIMNLQREENKQKVEHEHFVFLFGETSAKDNNGIKSILNETLEKAVEVFGYTV